MQTTRVVIGISPKAGAGDGRATAEQLHHCLLAKGLESYVAESLPEIQQLVRQAEPGPHHCCVVAAGGDGTLNLLASQLPPNCPIMPYPLGTENLVARHYGLFPNGCRQPPEWMAEVVAAGSTIPIDAGIARFPARGNRPARERMFLIMASVGFDAEVVRRMHLTRRGHIRRWSYFKPIWQTIRSYRYPAIQVVPLDAYSVPSPSAAASVDSSDQPLTVAWALVFNLPQYAARLAICPAADETDGQLDFCGFAKGSHFHGLRYFLGVASKQHGNWKDVVQTRGNGWRLSSNQPVAVQLDGDYVGRLPIDLQVLPKRVHLRLPADYQAKCDVV